MKNCSKSFSLCVFILSKKQYNWFYKNFHNSLNCIFNDLSFDLQLRLSFPWTKFELNCVILTKLATLGRLKVNVFRRGYDFIISVHEVLTKFCQMLKLYCICCHVTNVWQLSHFYERSYHSLKFHMDLTGKKLTLTGGLGTSSIIWDRH